MTITPTIGGVFISHQLAERLTKAWYETEARNELRALLDAPAKDPCAAALEHLERFKEVARSGDVQGVIEMAADLVGKAYFDGVASQPRGEPVAKSQWDVPSNPVLGYADSYRAMARQGAETVSIWSVITDLERNIAPLYAEKPAPVRMCDCIQGRLPCHGSCGRAATTNAIQ